MNSFNQGLNLLNVTITIGFFLSLTLSFFLLFRQSVKSRANIFLGLILLSYFFYLLPAFLFGMRLLQYLPHVIRLGGMFSLALGPLIWLYVLSCTRRNFKMQPKYWLHFIPLLLGIIYSSPFLLLDGESKYTILLHFLETGDYGDSYIEPVIKTVHAIVYFSLSLSVTLKYRQHINTTSSFIDLAYHQWLLFFSSALLFPVIGLILFVLTSYKSVSLLFLFLSILVFVFAVYLAILIKPEIFHKFPNRIQTISPNVQEKQKYENSNLQDAKKEKLVQKLLQYVEKEKPYLEPELTLGGLAEQINIPLHYLSQIINEKIKHSFLDFINSYRIEDAKKMLADTTYDHYTILAVAFEAGFNSKTAFYSAFKKFTNTTPSRYRKSFINRELKNAAA